MQQKKACVKANTYISEILKVQSLKFKGDIVKTEMTP